MILKNNINLFKNVVAAQGVTKIQFGLILFIYRETSKFQYITVSEKSLVAVDLVGERLFYN